MFSIIGMALYDRSSIRIFRLHDWSTTSRYLPNRLSRKDGYANTGIAASNVGHWKLDFLMSKKELKLL